MQQKCHRCDKFYTPTDNGKWCPDCKAGKPLEPRKTPKQKAKEQDTKMSRAYKYTRYCVQCGTKFYTNRTDKMVCGDWECGEKQKQQLIAAARKRNRGSTC